MPSLLRKITPVLVVDRIEPVLAFWKKLGSDPTVQMPDQEATDGRLAFAILAGEGFEVMYQTVASVRGDLVKSATVKDAFRTGPQQTVLYVDVAKLADIERALQGERLIIPHRTTFYGANELGYLDPGGNVVVFSEHAEKPAD
jgi:uncharacterized glyoxalase superfamily protein PhnB